MEKVGLSLLSKWLYPMYTAENWKIKLKIEKYCNEIIFKYVNSTVGSIFNEKWLKSDIYGSVNNIRCALIDWKLFDKSNFAVTVYTQYINSSHNSKICLKIWKKKKKKKTEHKNANAGPKHTRGGLCVFTADAQCTDGLFNVFGHYYKKDKLAIFF